MAQQHKNEQDNFDDALGSGKPNWAVLIPILVVIASLFALAYFI